VYNSIVSLSGRVPGINPLNAELNPFCHLLALLGGATIVVVSRLRVNLRGFEWYLNLLALESSFSQRSGHRDVLTASRREVIPQWNSKKC
jgi:hypothetical protein